MDAKAEQDPMLQRDGLARMAEWYVGGGDARAPLISPLYADLAGLPPLLIQVGTAETLLDDSTRLAAHARDAGVDVTLEPWDEMIHVFQAFAAILPEGQQAIERIGEFLRKHLS
jgi:acetyl esterase/lipase